MVPSGQMYFSGYYTAVKSIIQTKYIANQMGKCKDKATTVTPLSGDWRLEMIFPCLVSVAEREREREKSLFCHLLINFLSDLTRPVNMPGW